MKQKSRGERLLMRLAGDLRRGVPARRMLGEPSYAEDVEAFCHAVDEMVREDEGDAAAARLIKVLDFSRKVGRPPANNFETIAGVHRYFDAVEDYISEKESKARNPRRWKQRGGADGAMKRIAEKYDIKPRILKEWYTRYRRALKKSPKISG